MGQGLLGLPALRGVFHALPHCWPAIVGMARNALPWTTGGSVLLGHTCFCVGHNTRRAPLA